jgi:hypothetical protein
MVLTDIMLATGLAIGDASMLSKSQIFKNGTGWHAETKRAKTGTTVNCPISAELGKEFHAFPNKTPFWSGDCGLKRLTENWRRIYVKIFRACGRKGSSAYVLSYVRQATSHRRRIVRHCCHVAGQYRGYRQEALFEVGSRAASGI